jgi:glycosyltransferase involved in cell wall biosynthesis
MPPGASLPDLSLSDRRIRVITRDNGAGLQRDLELVIARLQEQGLQPEALRYRGSKLLNRLREARTQADAWWRGRVGTQVFLERVYPRCLPLGERNVLIPNPEWLHPHWHPLLERFDAILCKTRQAERIFAGLGLRTRYIGFTGEDRMDASVPRQDEFLHVVGRSTAKGTDAVLDAWRRNPHWPTLTVLRWREMPDWVRHVPNIEYRSARMSHAALRDMQNRHRFHLCPSEAEGFGHSLIEAMSVGAVVLATDGEPMNELIDASRGVLIAPQGQSPMALGTRYTVTVDAIETAVEAALALSAEQRQVLGNAARKFFLDNDLTFGERLFKALGSLPETLADGALSDLENARP